jgi:cyclopropane fatty-acyl-phospholipid synthase-like methyltransferase
MPTWDELFKQEKFRQQEPDHGVVRFAKLLKEKGFRRILDLGCGAGRHLVYLAKEGFEVFGTDISETGLGHARRWLKQEGLTAELKRSDMTEIPYPDRFFDAAISIAVIYHGTLAEMRRAIAEVHRVLRPGGLALLTLKSKRSFRYGKGEEIESDTYIPDTGEDSGVPHHYSDREETEELLRDFVIREINHMERIFEGGYHSSYWEVWLEKP